MLCCALCEKWYKYLPSSLKWIGVGPSVNANECHQLTVIYLPYSVEEKLFVLQESVMCGIWRN